jgi:signal transduction histidine kinase
MRAGASVMTRTATVQVRTAPGRHALFARVRTALRPILLSSDGMLAAALTGFALVTVVRATHPVSAGVLAAVATTSLTWRRLAPTAILLTTTACLFAEKLLGYPRTALAIAVLVALYTVAVIHRVLFTAVAASVLLAGAVACDLIRHGWTITDFDDQFFAYVMALGATCALGYAVQLSRARNQLMQAREARLEAEHAGREQLLLRQEQARIARELHDVIAHQVCVITALAAGADRLILTQPQRAKQALNSIEAAGREALTEMRVLLRVLRTDPAEAPQSPQPGMAQLPALVEQMQLAGLPVRLSVEGRPRLLPVSVEVTAYRIVQQALTNSLRHAGPARADVLVRYRPVVLELDIRDDGRGLPDTPKAGHGLIGMRERAALAGGCLLVGAGPEGGTRVVAKLPITGNQHRAGDGS